MAAKVVTRVIDQGTKLQLYFSATQSVYIDKSSIKLRLTGDLIFLYDNSMSDTVVTQGTTRIYLLDYTVITVPSVASAALLAVAVLAMLNTGGTDTSDLAKEVTLQHIDDTLNVALSTRASEVTLIDVKNATEATQAFLESNFDIPLSTLDGDLDTINNTLLLGLTYAPGQATLTFMSGTLGTMNQKLLVIQDTIVAMDVRNRFDHLSLEHINSTTANDLETDMNTFAAANPSRRIVTVNIVFNGLTWDAYLYTSVD